MAEYITLIGAEGVENAGRNMQGSADSMRDTAGYIDESLNRFINRFEELVCRLENISKEPKDGK